MSEFANWQVTVGGLGCCADCGQHGGVMAWHRQESVRDKLEAMRQTRRDYFDGHPQGSVQPHELEVGAGMLADACITTYCTTCAKKRLAADIQALIAATRIAEQAEIIARECSEALKPLSAAHNIAENGMESLRDDAQTAIGRLLADNVATPDEKPSYKI